MSLGCRLFHVFFFKQKTAYDMRISDWSSDVCSSDLSMPSLNVPCDARSTSFSSRPRNALTSRICGMVASPTPTMPISSDSIKRMRTGCTMALARIAAAIKPPVTPPPMTSERMLHSKQDEPRVGEEGGDTGQDEWTPCHTT